LNAQLAARIKWLDKITDLAQHQIAAQLGVNQGRISEVLNGKRFSSVQPSP
jgi:predicted XRE-type DNA-binding protein